MNKKVNKKDRRFFGLDVNDKYTPLKILSTVVGLWLSCWLLIYFFINDGVQSWASRGQFGDMFGAVNALFSGLAFAGIIFTILLQRADLDAQKKELRLARKEYKQQNTTLSLQRFENTFFNLLNLHNEITSGIDNRGQRGRAAFDYILDQNAFGFGAESRKNFKPEYYDLFKAQYIDQFMKDNYRYYAHHVENLASIVRIVNGSDLAQEAKINYYGILTSIISVPEKRFLVYHLNFADEDPTVLYLKKFQRLTRFLSNISPNQLLHASHYSFVERLSGTI